MLSFHPKILGAAASALVVSFPFAARAAAPQAPFTVVSHAAKVVSAADLAKAEAAQTPGAASDDKKTLTYTATDIRLVARTGPEDDMLSYRIQGVRNPTLVVPKNAKIRLLFVNTDGDMPHDLHFSALKAPFPIAPLEGAVGTAKLAHEENAKFFGEELSLSAPNVGSFTYFCSVRGHAKGGMFGTIAVGTAPDASAAPVAPMPAMPGMDMPGMAMPSMNKPAAKNDAAPATQSGSMPGMAMPGMSMPAKTDAAPAAQSNSMPGMSILAPKNSAAPATSPDAMSGMAMPAAKDSAASATQSDAMSGMNMTGGAMTMRSTIDLNDPMSRESSGTAWLPDSSPMYMRMRMKGQRMTMIHGVAFPRFTRVGGDRDVSSAGEGGRSRFDAPSMFMGMASQPLGAKGQIGVRLMTSLDPIIEGGYGYPLLYQSGEAYRGEPIHDRQHPHDLISELSVTYSRSLSARKSVYGYVGYPGEPALGPPTFMHRVSGMDNPDAPLSHHWQDSTHITFGVATLGYSVGKIKLEGSAFKGEEPNENRYNFDSPRLDSFSTRLSWNPTRDLALQVSTGTLKHPEPAEPEVSQRQRTTASVILNRARGNDANWSNALVWGQNRDRGGVGGTSNAYLFETAYQRRADTFYTRFERVQKSGDELVLPAPNDARLFSVGSYAVGYVHDVKHNTGLDVGVGTQVTFGTNPLALDEVYGGRNHTGFQVFLRLRPSKMRDDAMSGMSGMTMSDGK